MLCPHRDLLKIGILRHEMKMCVNDFHSLTPYLISSLCFYIQQKPLSPRVFVLFRGLEIFLAAPEIAPFQIQIFLVGLFQNLLLI